MASFTGVGDTTTLTSTRKGNDVSVAISGTYDMTIALQREVGSPNSGSWEEIERWSTANATVAYTHTTKDDRESLRLIVLVDNSGTATATLSEASSSDEVRDDITGVDGETKVEFREDGVEIPTGQDLNVVDEGSLKENDVHVRNNVGTTLDAAATLTAADSGKTYFLNDATEFAVTLPAPAAGLNFRFVVAAAPVGANYTVVTSGGSNIILGHVTTADVDNAGNEDSEVSGADTVNFVASTSVVGDFAEFHCDGTNWFVHGSCTAAGGVTITTAA